METLFDLPNGDRVWVLDTATAAGYLGTMLQRFREGEQEPLFYGDEPRPQGVVISFEQWAEYETLRKEADFEQRMLQTTRERLANDRQEDNISFEDAARADGWDLDVEDDGDTSGPEPTDGRT